MACLPFVRLLFRSPRENNNNHHHNNNSNNNNSNNNNRYMETVLCWHTSLALAELAYCIAEAGPLGLAVAARDMHFHAGELADWVARWLEHGLLEHQRLHRGRERYEGLMGRAYEAARLYLQRDNAMRQHVATMQGRRVDVSAPIHQREVRAWHAALSDVVSWSRVCGPPAAGIVAAVLEIEAGEVLHRLQMRLYNASARGRRERDTRLRCPLRIPSPIMPM